MPNEIYHICHDKSFIPIGSGKYNNGDGFQWGTVFVKDGRIYGYYGDSHKIVKASGPHDIYGLDFGTGFRAWIFKEFSNQLNVYLDIGED